MTVMLEARNLNFAYPSVRVLEDVAIDVFEGESHVIIGPNGAGKTTLFKILSGEMLPQTGWVKYQGRDVTAKDAFERVHLGIGRTFQVARLFQEQSVLMNLVLALECRDRIEGVRRPWWRINPAPEVIAEARERIAAFALHDLVNETAANLSHGDKKRLELMVSLCLHPKLIMLDEPTAGMAPEDRRSVVRLIHRLRKEQELTLLLTEHDMEVVFSLATRLTVLNLGRVIASGNPEEVRRDRYVHEIYFGRKGGGHA